MVFEGLGTREGKVAYAGFKCVQIYHCMVVCINSVNEVW